MKTKIGLIYVLTNKINNKKYVGFTTNLNHTIYRHRTRAEQGCNYLLSNAIRKHGWNNFIIEVIYKNEDYQYVKNVMEPYYIKELDTFYENKKGYNMTLGGEGTFGFKKSKEEKEAASKRMKGHIKSDKTKEKLSLATKGKNNPNYGKHHSAETRAKISAANKGKGRKKWTKDQKEKMSEYQKNRIRTPREIERVRQMAFAKRGLPGKLHTKEHKKHMSEIMTGRKFSENTIKKMRKNHYLSAKFIYKIKSPDGKIYETYDMMNFAKDFNMCNDSLLRSFKTQKPCVKFNAKGWLVISKESLKGKDRSHLREKYSKKGWILLD